MIIYRKSNQLRFRRTLAPEPPWFCATAVAPYGPRRGSPVSIDYLDLRATAAERAEVAVCDAVSDEIERNAGRLQAPVLIEATEMAEQIFRRGEEALNWCAGHELPALHLISTRAAIPAGTHAEAVVAVVAWPPEIDALRALCSDFAARGGRWGMVVPVVYPVTTGLGTLDALALAA